MFDSDFRMVEEVIDVVHFSADVVLVRAEGMPVVHVIELQVNAVVIVIARSKQQVGFVDELEVVVGQMVDVVLDYDLDQFT